MSRHAIRAIVRKDLAAVVRNRGVRTPLLVTPIILLIVLPIVLVSGGEILARSGQVPIDDLPSTPFERLNDEAFQDRATGGDLPPEARWVVFVLEVFIAPLFLLVPLIVSTVIAADSFAGERERKTLEALLHTPTSDRELMTAKFLAAWIPAVVVSTVGFTIYSLLANALAWPQLGRVFFPSITWLLLAFWVAPGLAALGLGIMVIASSRVRSLQAAHQIGSLVVLPLVLLLIAQISGVLLLDSRVVATMGAVIWIGAMGTVAVGARALRRQELALRI